MCLTCARKWERGSLAVSLPYGCASHHYEGVRMEGHWCYCSQSKVTFLCVDSVRCVLIWWNWKQREHGYLPHTSHKRAGEVRRSDIMWFVGYEMSSNRSKKFSHKMRCVSYWQHRDGVAWDDMVWPARTNRIVKRWLSSTRHDRLCALIELFSHCQFPSLIM